MDKIKTKKELPKDHWISQYRGLSKKNKTIFWVTISGLILFFTVALVFSLLYIYKVIKI